MDAALATGLASEDPVMLTTARVDGDRAYFGNGSLSERVEVVEATRCAFACCGTRRPSIL